MSQTNHKHSDCLLVFVITTSTCDKNGDFLIQNETMTVAELCEPFTGLNCSSLISKPKLFFIQVLKINFNQHLLFYYIHIQFNIISEFSC